MIGMYTSLNGLVGALGKRIRAIKAPGEREISTFFGTMRSCYIASPYQTWEAFVVLDGEGLVVGVQDINGKYIAKDKRFVELEQTEIEREVSKRIVTFKKHIAVGTWTRAIGLAEIAYQIEWNKRNGKQAWVDAWLAAQEDF